LECLENAGRQHRAAGGLSDYARELLDERICVRAARDEHEAGLRAELTDAESERAEEPLRDGAAPLLQSTRQHEYRIDAAHLREDRDRMRPRARDVEQRAACGMRAGEADGGRARMPDQCRPGLRPPMDE